MPETGDFALNSHAGASDNFSPNSFTISNIIYGENISEINEFTLLLVCMSVCVFMALITTVVLCASSQHLVMSVSLCRVHVVLPTAGFKGGRKPCRKIRETPRYGEASRRPLSLSRVRTQAIGALAQSSDLSIYPSAQNEHRRRGYWKIGIVNITFFKKTNICLAECRYISKI